MSRIPVSNYTRTYLAVLLTIWMITVLVGLNTAGVFAFDSGIDLRILLAINQGWSSRWADTFFIWISSRSTFSTPLLLIILALLSWHYRIAGLKLWGILIVALILGDQLGNLLKIVFSEPRPCAVIHDIILQPKRPQGGSCGAVTTGSPSNHALNFFLTATFLGLVLQSWRWWIPLLLIAVSVSLSRIYLGVHYPSQVLFGGLIGFLLGDILTRFVRNRFPFTRTLQRHGPAPPGPDQQV